MKKVLLVSLLLVAILGLASCSDADAPLTEAQQAEQYNMSVAEYKEIKTAAAQMNMTVEDHMKGMGGGNNSSMEGMDMGDDSSMIEDDSMDISSHTMDDGMKMNNNETMVENSSHTMDDGAKMTDEEMHIEVMHDGDKTVEKHPSAEH